MIKVKRLHPSARLPQRGTDGAAGLDLFAALDAPVVLDPGAWTVVPCGIAIELNPGQVGYVHSRSGLAKNHGIKVLNGPGVIDEDYRGELGALLINHSNKAFVIEHGFRIAQLVVQKYDREECEWYDALSETERGSGGFGSTGIK